MFNSESVPIFRGRAAIQLDIARPLSPIGTKHLTNRRLGVLVLAEIAVGTVLFLLIYRILGGRGGPTQTLFASGLGGAVGVVAAGLWVLRHSKGKLVLLLLVAAFLTRLTIGVVYYIGTMDGGYFGGPGIYASDNYEFYQTYGNAVIAANAFRQYGEWRPSRVFAEGMTKNPNIHEWMGLYLAAGRSRNCLDIASLNSFSHVLAGILIIAIALVSGYEQRAALLAGVVTAWIPWGFPASIMWRDSVGLAWLALAVFLVVLAKQFWIPGLLLLVPAYFLASSVREVYGIILCGTIGLIYFAERGRKRLSRPVWMLGLAVATAIFTAVLVYQAQHTILMREQVVIQTEGWKRIEQFPLLAIRAVAGPFPWGADSLSEALWRLPDYAYHVLQLGCLLFIARYYKQLLRGWDSLLAIAALVWGIGTVAIGVHTAYLAVAMPFALPFIFGTNKSLKPYILAALLVFIFANALYLLLGLQGTAPISGITGY